MPLFVRTLSNSDFSKSIRAIILYKLEDCAFSTISSLEMGVEIDGKNANLAFPLFHVKSDEKVFNPAIEELNLDGVQCVEVFLHNGKKYTYIRAADGYEGYDMYYHSN